MASRTQEQAAIDPTLCRRCRVTNHSIVVRTEPLCVDCFCRYAQIKVLKRMETFRVRPGDHVQERRVLLALSLGSCSTALLHVLSEQLRRQAERTGRTWYKLCILHIIDDAQDHHSRWDGIRSRYPGHEYISVPYSDCASIGSTLQPFVAPAGTAAGEETPAATTNDEKPRFSLDMLPSPTARSDTARILLRRLVVRTAKTHGCEAVLWGDSTTKLAERTLAETAKGRGFSLPWMVADGETPQGIAFHYPLRDLLSGEIRAYASYLRPSLTDFIVDAIPKPAVSTKNTTIDDLMQQYFSTVERDYPSIVSNVVRTTAKLHPPSLSEIEEQCELCEMPLEGRSPSKSRLCYGCIRTLPSAP